eukprot:m.59296 g.59296  ORF g.59296 m.59296 type:complete len:144 (+) comp34880_c0_seq6:904-1335(+)
MLDIEINHVSVPALHVSLGIFCRLFTLFEDACKRLDKQIAQEGVKESLDAADKAENKAKILEEKSELALQYMTWHCLDSQENSSEIEACREEANRLQEKAKTLREFASGLSCVKTTDGPCVNAVDTALSACGIARQAYFGGLS